MHTALSAEHDRLLHCPIRSASVLKTSKDPLGLLWVLISLEMFLPNTEKHSDFDARILRRKSRAYQLMAKRLGDPQNAQSLGFIICTGSAALAELFFGDPMKGIMHLGAVETILESMGGVRAIADLPHTITIPMIGAFAHRTTLCQSLQSWSQFDAAHRDFMDMMRTLISHHECSGQFQEHNIDLTTLERKAASSTEHDKESLLTFSHKKHQIFVRGSPLRNFIEPESQHNNPADYTDYFILLFCLNVALYDFGHGYDSASTFLDKTVEDIKIADARRDSNSYLKISGARCIFISRLAQAFVLKGNQGVVRAWQSIGGLEVLKFLLPESRAKIFHTLAGLLTGGEYAVMTLDELDLIDIEASTSWWDTYGSHNPATTRSTE
jgi:hypothetical protein